MELAESGMIGATKPRIPLCCMRATCCKVGPPHKTIVTSAVNIRHDYNIQMQGDGGALGRSAGSALRQYIRRGLAQAATTQRRYKLGLSTSPARKPARIPQRRPPWAMEHMNQRPMAYLLPFQRRRSIRCRNCGLPLTEEFKPCEKSP